MNSTLDVNEIVVYDFSNLNDQENSTDNCFGCDSCDYGECDSCDSCDSGW